MASGTGVYGEVFLMKALGIKPPENESTVVVKSLLSKDDNVRGDLEQEIEMYSKLDHPNIAALLGICMEKEPIYVITEYLEYVSFGYLIDFVIGYPLFFSLFPSGQSQTLSTSFQTLSTKRH